MTDSKEATIHDVEPVELGKSFEFQNAIKKAFQEKSGEPKEFWDQWMACLSHEARVAPPSFYNKEWEHNSEMDDGKSSNGKKTNGMNDAPSGRN